MPTVGSSSVDIVVGGMTISALAAPMGSCRRHQRSLWKSTPSMKSPATFAASRFRSKMFWIMSLTVNEKSAIMNYAAWNSRAHSTREVVSLAKSLVGRIWAPITKLWSFILTEMRWWRAVRNARKLPSLRTCSKRITRMKYWRHLRQCWGRRCRRISSKPQSNQEDWWPSLSLDSMGTKWTRLALVLMPGLLAMQRGSNLEPRARQSDRAGKGRIRQSSGIERRRKPIKFIIVLSKIKFSICIQIQAVSLHGIQRRHPRRSPSHKTSGMHSFTKQITISERSRLTVRSSAGSITGKSLPMLALSMSWRLVWQPSRHLTSTHHFQITNSDSPTMDSGSSVTQTTPLVNPMASSSRKRACWASSSIWTSEPSLSLWMENSWGSHSKTNCLQRVQFGQRYLYCTSEAWLWYLGLSLHLTFR